MLLFFYSNKKKNKYIYELSQFMVVGTVLRVAHSYRISPIADFRKCPNKHYWTSMKLLYAFNCSFSFKASLRLLCSSFSSSTHLSECIFCSAIKLFNIVKKEKKKHFKIIDYCKKQKLLLFIFCIY